MLPLVFLVVPVVLLQRAVQRLVRGHRERREEAIAGVRALVQPGLGHAGEAVGCVIAEVVQVAPHDLARRNRLDQRGPIGAAGQR